MPVRNHWCSILALTTVFMTSNVVAEERRVEFTTDDNITIAATLSEPLHVSGKIAAIDWLEQSGHVDMSRIAVIGASIGANLACVAAGSSEFPVKTAVDALIARWMGSYNSDQL